MADTPEKITIRPGDTKIYTDTFTDTETGLPISADLTDGTWEATSQIRRYLDPASAVVATFDCEITSANSVKRTLTEDQSSNLDDVPFTASPATGKRKVYWDAQLRKTDGIAAGEDYVFTYLSGVVTIPGQVTRAV